MEPQSRRGLPASFLDRLVAQVDPHRSAALQGRDARRACGRWLALRRLELGFSGEEVARSAGLTAEALLLLEAGMGEPSLVPSAARTRLAEALVRPDTPWLAEVVDVASGAAAARDEVVEQLIAELDLVDSLPAASRQALLDELLIASPTAAAQGEHAAQPTDDPVVFEILTVLAEADRHTYAIWEAVSQRYGRIGVANIGGLVVRLLERQWIAEAAKRIEPELDSEPLQYYRLTTTGRGVLEAELTRREQPSVVPAPNTPPASSPLREGGG
jgi:transcriptional regulator with XRE-family HTH domain